MSKPSNVRAEDARRIALFGSKTKRSPIVASHVNELVTALNSLMNLTVVRGSSDKFTFTAANSILELKRTSESETVAAASTLSLYKISSIANLANHAFEAQLVTVGDDNVAAFSAAVTVAVPMPLWGAVLSPDYAVNQYVFVATCETGTGVVPPGGTQVKLVDLGIGRLVVDSITMFKVSGLFGDYLVCRTWDGTTLGATDVVVAKDPHFRTSLTSELIDGVPMTYDYADSNNRTSDDGDNSQIEVLFPRYVAGGATEPHSTIYACPSSNGTGVTVSGTPVKWIEVLPSRLWARRNVQ